MAFVKPAEKCTFAPPKNSGQVLVISRKQIFPANRYQLDAKS